MSEEKKKVGRPKGSGKQTDWENINIRVSPIVKKGLESKAEKKGLSLNAYLTPTLKRLSK